MNDQASKIEIWQKHLNQGAEHPKSIAAYCREHGIKASTFHSWRSRLRRARSKKAAGVSPFVAVTVEKEIPERSLPEAQWLGRFAAELIRGLENERR